ncbi:regulator [Vibrio fluminensis]|uniref:regulator n=1 Tax=Vibrio fluminensis TaxID=2783614 RepID=UPI001887F555|nr:regulator [Vibrio fluminensis]
MTICREITKNYLFRRVNCGLTIKETAELCFKSIEMVEAWDKGKPIPPECKRLMRKASKNELSHLKSWNNFAMINGKMKLPTGKLVTAQQIILGIALIEIGASNDAHTSKLILRYARAIKDLM